MWFLQPIEEKGWQTRPGAIGMSCLGFTLLEGRSDVVDTVVVRTDTCDRVPIAEAGGASCRVSGIQVIEVSLAPGKMQEGDSVQIIFSFYWPTQLDAIQPLAGFKVIARLGW